MLLWKQSLLQEHSPVERKDNAVLQTPEHEANMDSLPGLINKRKKKITQKPCMSFSQSAACSYMIMYFKDCILHFSFFLLLPQFPLGLFLSSTSFCSFLYLLYCDLLFSPTSLFISGHKMSSGTKKLITKPFSVSASPISSFLHYSWFTHFQRLVHTETMFLT